MGEEPAMPHQATREHFRGPEHWHKHYPIAKGDNQSPIEINSKEVHYDPSLLPWFVGYDPVGARTIVNNGRTCKVVFDDTFNRSVLRNGPLPGIYRLRQLHFHWGSSNDHGSEHIVDGVKYAGELHLVHWYSKYSNYAEALRNYDGVAILGIFLQVGKTQKPEMKRILEEINGIKTKMAKLRSLSINADTEPARPMLDNWRPPQPRHFRMVRASFQ
ncbi:carbonic anhydrase 3-like isoform X3 [Mauremys mutica]|uniref:carbonic anhydrase 3-like isoform X3 n=1 Tax=Mauremys mutica TaxID=74926 RepID=UPI001D16D558|nr:carbonic anhydrase 3-like isoform X3 [Mauremys mutica]